MPSPSLSVKITFTFSENSNYESCQQTFENKTFVDITQQCFALLPEVNFPANNLKGKGDGIESRLPFKIFSTINQCIVQFLLDIILRFVQLILRSTSETVFKNFFLDMIFIFDIDTSIQITHLNFFPYFED